MLNEISQRQRQVMYVFHLYVESKKKYNVVNIAKGSRRKAIENKLGIISGGEGQYQCRAVESPNS